MSTFEEWFMEHVSGYSRLLARCVDRSVPDHKTSQSTSWSTSVGDQHLGLHPWRDDQWFKGVDAILQDGQMLS